ncbi:hypothetical protein BKP37_14160 [Anaerobacillus alkalilacustris]|uniref:Bh protein n=1 Tax=Anaerobacillus alkalilacustris TaxID=393763 RepID=A0A1S2LJM3_9BACI|nr:hypothetical protein [Anaerobacillus alkalilacustris]OIJ12566.1 hypothetical protein BKP37_14160 [Anaerobacillus alkalilacustris]
MKKTHIEVDLYCIQCNEEVPHEIAYLNEKIIRTECLMCKNCVEIIIDPKKEFYKAICIRIVTKPSRVSNEYKENLNHFLCSLPARVITKPYRLLTDFKEVIEIIGSFKGEGNDNKNKIDK